jgi:hypothetical protein
MIMPHLAKTVFEVEGEDDMEEVSVYELHLTETLIFGVFVWPRGWPWTWGFIPGLYRANGVVFHAGFVSFGYYHESLAS